MSMKPFTEILTVITPWSEVQTILKGQYDHIANMFTTLQSIFLLFFPNHVRKIKCIVVMSKKPSF